MKKSIHLSKSLDEEKHYPSQISKFKKDNPQKNFPINSSKKNKTSAPSLILFPEKNKYLFEKSFNQGMPTSNFLEEMYLKYSKNLQKYFLKNQTGLKLAGNKYFKNLTVEDYMKQNNLTQEEFIHLLNNFGPISNPNSIQNFENEISKENFFLTPLPNKSRQLLSTNKEKNDFLEAERSAVVMRTFEYTHGIKSKVGIRELKKIMVEQKQRLINLMLASASKIQRWWKKKYLMINKNKKNEKYDKKIIYYNDMLNKKKAKIFFDKIKGVIKKKKKEKYNYFINKLKLKAKNSNKKFFSYSDWINNMKICSQIIKFNLIKNKFPLIKKNYDFVNSFFITKKSYKNQSNNSQNGLSNELSQIKKIIFLQKTFRQYIKKKKLKQNLKKFNINNNSQFSYFTPNEMNFLYNKNINSDAKEMKNIPKKNFDLYYNPNTKKKANLEMLSPISKNINENDDDLYNDNINNEVNYKTQKDNNNEIVKRNNNGKLFGNKTTGDYNIEVRGKISDKINKKVNNKDIPIKKIFPSKENNKKNNNRESSLKQTKQSKLNFNNNNNKINIHPKSNKSKKIESNKLSYNNNNFNTDSENNNKIKTPFSSKNTYKNSFPKKSKKISKIPQKTNLKNNLLKIEENELSLITTTNNNNINNNTSQNNNNLLLIDSLELEKEKKIDKKIINAINSNIEENENLENSIPPELNMDNYQQDSTLDFRDKRIKSNQKTISTSAILHLDTSDNHILINNQYNHESSYPFQFLGQICLNFLHRPLIVKKNSYIEKINKKEFSLDIKNSLNKIITIRNNFSFEKKMAIEPIFFLKIFFGKWKKNTNKTSNPYVYSKIITSICTMDNSEKNTFSYYCRINKSNQENDFLLLRISLGYKLLRKIFCLNDIKKFMYLLKRRRRRNFRAKTFNYGDYSKNVFHLLEFKIKLPVILNKIIIKKYFGIFFHKFLLFSMNLEKNEKFSMNNGICKLIFEGYRKGYFGIFCNIMNIKIKQQYFNTGLKLGNFIEIILRLKED